MSNFKKKQRWTTVTSLYTNYFYFTLHYGTDTTPNESAMGMATDDTIRRMNGPIASYQVLAEVSDTEIL